MIFLLFPPSNQYITCDNPNRVTISIDGNVAPTIIDSMIQLVNEGSVWMKPEVLETFLFKAILQFKIW